jgi:hypothetical protein
LSILAPVILEYFVYDNDILFFFLKIW